MASKSFSTQGPDIPHLSKGEVADLRSDVEAAFTVSEARTPECTPQLASRPTCSLHVGMID